MEPANEVLAFAAGIPAIVGLLLASALVFLTANWRISLATLFFQYLLIGVALTRFVQLEVALLKVLVGGVAVPILYLTARRIHEERVFQLGREQNVPFAGSRLGWDAGPLGLPLRIFVLLLIALAVIQIFAAYSLPLVPADMALVTVWLAGMGLGGLLISSDPLRVAPSLLTILAGFDLVYSIVEPSLAVVGFVGALTILAALAFSYLALVHGLGGDTADSEGQGS
jgi:hypothetical protein